MSTSTKFMLATAGVLVVGIVGYFIVPSLVENVGMSHAAPAIREASTTLVSTAVPTTEGLPPLDEPIPSALGSGKIERLAKAFVAGAGSHAASGTALELAAGSSTYLRYEGLASDNGPDLHVYLSKDMNASGGGIDLGLAKTTSGSVNYSLPASTDVKAYPYVLMWSKQYGALFNYAKMW